LPFTTKTDLRDNYPDKLRACPKSEITRIHASSGTTGKPTVVLYTKNDVDMWSDCVARSMTMAGISKNDTVQVSYGYGLFTGGLGAHYGAEKIGASVIPTSSGNTKRQLLLMEDLQVDAICCTPSYSLLLSEALEENNINTREMPLRVGIFGAEPWSEAMRAEIERRLNINAYNIYGLSEIAGPGVAMECTAKNGMHIMEDNFIAEIINPETGEVLPDGETGELVFTTITKEGMPLLRYRTRDLTKLLTETCACGRTHARIDRIMGRSDDMLIIRGVNVFPSQIESVLLDMGQTSPHYHLIVDRIDNKDTLEVQVEVSDSSFSSIVRELEGLRAHIKKEIENTLGISVKVTLVEHKTLARSEGKAVRVTDRRTSVNF
ncbi:MAG: phenylacetate--CoA ligase family protein, partial [Anaerotignaceae bacterium]